MVGWEFKGQRNHALMSKTRKALICPPEGALLWAVHQLEIQKVPFKHFVIVLNFSKNNYAMLLILKTLGQCCLWDSVLLDGKCLCGNKQNWTRLCYRKLCIAKMLFIISLLLCWKIWFAFTFHVLFDNIFCVWIISKHCILLVECCLFYWETCKLFPLEGIALLNMAATYF